MPKKLLKKYCVVYSIKQSTDASVLARDEEEAKDKVLEVIPDATIEDVWEETKEGNND